MEKGSRGKRIATIIIILICAALAAFIIWGVCTLLDRLTAYGNSASIQDSQSTQEDTEAAEIKQAYEELPKNTYDAEGFTTENGLMRYETDTVIGVPGIDVSSYQQNIDWQKVKAAGVEFAMIRLGYRGYSSGKLDLDNCFLENMEGAKEAGIDIGVYFFSQALNEEEAVEEAEYVINWLRGYDLKYPVAFDWEEVNVEARTDDMDLVKLTSCALAFCERIEEAGYRSAVYFNQAYGYQQLYLPSLKEFDFWLASYEATPTFLFDFQMWQYSDSGTVDGIEGPVDLNIGFQNKE